jgi:hypothetical protein
MVHEGVHNPAAHCSDSCADRYCGADPYACAHRVDANTDTNSAIHTGGNRFKYGFGNSYAADANTDTNSAIHTGGNR